MTVRKEGFLAKFRKFNWEERRALAEAMILVMLAAPLIRLMTLPAIARFAAFGPWGTNPQGERHEELVELVSWAVDRAAKRSPLRSLCFERGLAAQIMLRRRGVDATLLYGVGTGKLTGEAIDAHVWVRVGTQQVIGEPEPGHFAVLMTCPPGRTALAGQTSAENSPR